MYKLPEDLGCKYEFVTLAAARAEQLQMGALPRTKKPGKFTVTAQEEVATGLVVAVDPDAPDEEEQGAEAQE